MHRRVAHQQAEGAAARKRRVAAPPGAVVADERRNAEHGVGIRDIHIHHAVAACCGQPRDDIVARTRVVDVLIDESLVWTQHNGVEHGIGRHEVHIDFPHPLAASGSSECVEAVVVRRDHQLVHPQRVARAERVAHQLVAVAVIVHPHHRVNRPPGAENAHGVCHHGVVPGRDRGHAQQVGRVVHSRHSLTYYSVACHHAACGRKLGIHRQLPVEHVAVVVAPAVQHLDIPSAVHGASHQRAEILVGVVEIGALTHIRRVDGRIAVVAARACRIYHVRRPVDKGVARRVLVAAAVAPAVVPPDSRAVAVQ